jgi:hypothetical protein
VGQFFGTAEKGVDSSGMDSLLHIVDNSKELCPHLQGIHDVIGATHSKKMGADT